MVSLILSSKKIDHMLIFCFWNGLLSGLFDIIVEEHFQLAKLLPGNSESVKHGFSRFVCSKLAGLVRFCRQFWQIFFLDCDETGWFEPLFYGKRVF